MFNDICNRKKVIYARTFFHTDEKNNRTKEKNNQAIIKNNRVNGKNSRTTKKYNRVNGKNSRTTIKNNRVNGKNNRTTIFFPSCE